MPAPHALRSLRAASAALLLSGCAAGGLPLGPAVSVPAESFVQAQGEADLVVRAFAEGPDGTALEVGGANCEVSSILFAARLVTPATLRVPNFGPQSPTLVFDCRAGDLAGTAERPVATRWLRAPGAWPGPGPYGPYGAWGGPWGGPWGWGGGPNYLVAYYPDVAVRLAPVP